MPPRMQLLLVLSTLLALPACDEPRLIERLESMRADCVVIVIDAAASKRLGSYGYGRETTPNIDGLARGGVLFERAYSQAPSTVISVPSFLTGLYPHAIAVRRESQTARAIRYLPQAFASAGFRSAGFTQNVVAALSFPASEVFEHFGGHLKGRQGTGPNGAAVVREALQWVDSVGDDRIFLYVHLLPPHAPYTPPKEHIRFRPPGYEGSLRPVSSVLDAIDRGKLQVSADDVDFLVSQYDANLHHADALVASLLDGLARRGRLARSVVVLTADHGEAFGEHGRFVHNTTLYDEMIRVPLVVSLPKELGLPPSRVRESVGLVDLAPTLLELFGLDDELARQAAGTSLAAALEFGSLALPPRMIFAQNSDHVAAVEGEFKLILRKTKNAIEEELYHLGNDPGERRDLAEVEAQRANRMRAAVGHFLDERVESLSLEAAAEAMSEETRRQLNALGYLLEPPEHDPEAAAP